MGSLSASRSHPRPSQDPDVGLDNPLIAAASRYQGRLDANGTMPDNYLENAMAARKRLASRHPSGPTSWTFLGPTNLGGRIRSILLHPTNPNIMWIGSCGGGIWKSLDGGTTWNPMDDFLPGMAIGCMALDPTNPNILYAGTGEGFFETDAATTNTSCIRGAGIFKSVDGGTTWTQIPATKNPDFYFVNRLSISPANPNVILSATSTGIFRSIDGGVNWTKTLANEWAYDVDFNPNDASKAVAGVHEKGVYYSNDGGVTWTHSTSIATHRSEVAYAPSDPSIVYVAAADNEQITIWRSADGGVTFTHQSAAAIGNYAAYNDALWVNPTDSASIIYGGVYLYGSNDSGASNTPVLGDVHADMHTIVTQPGFNGTSNRTIFIGCDGGLYKVPAYNVNSATFISGMGMTQFYGAAINPISGRVMGGTQDNYTLLYSGDKNNWTISAGGDGGYNQTDPNDSRYFYGCVYWAYQFRSIDGGFNTDYIFNGPNPITDAGDNTRVNFINPFTLDPNNSSRMLVGTIQLWRSNNVKAAQPDWFVIKPSIAPPGRDGKGGVGGINAHMLPNNPYNISTVTVAKGNSDIIWVGHNNGQVFKTTNGTATQPTWKRVDTTGPLPARWVSKIAIDPQNSNHVYVSYLGWHDDSIFETKDGGLSWKDIASGKLIPASVNVIALHPTQPGWLYAGTDLGLYTSTDNGLTWTTVPAGPGTVSIEEITFKDAATFVVATYGRGMWMCQIAFSSTPEITTISPTNGIAGGSGFELTVNGKNFTSSSIVKWNGANRPTVYVSPNQLKAAIPSSDIAFAQVVPIQVTTPPPGGGNSNVVSFTINNPVPNVTSITPSTVTAGSSAFTLTVNGSNFISGSKIKWNGVVRNTVYVSPTKLTTLIAATDIATVGSALISVFNVAPGGGDSSTATLSIVNAYPVALSINYATLTGGMTANAVVTLSGPAPVGGLVLAMTKSGPCTVPATLTVPAGKTYVAFSIPTQATATTTTCTIGATANSHTAAKLLQVQSPRPTSLNLNPSTVTGGTSSVGSFTLSGPAPVGGMNVTILTGMSWIAQVPATVFVAAGQTSGTFTITTKKPAQTTSVGIWALYQGRGMMTFLDVNP